MRPSTPPSSVNATSETESSQHASASLEQVAASSQHAPESALSEALIASNRLAMAGTSAAMLAHEFNNLMTPVLARSVDALESDDPQHARHAIERTVGQIEKAIRLSRHLLRLADPRPVEGEAQVCGARQAAEEALAEAIRPFRKDHIEVVVRADEALRLAGAAYLVEQVLLNLLLNARAAIKPNPGRIEISAERDGAMVRFEVADSGHGIPATELGLVFRPFLQRSEVSDPNAWRQVGLGLLVCREIVTQHGGRMDVMQNARGGCTFQVWWPAAE